ncbi:MAG: glycosyltransferase family 4 protein [Dehalococcoidales bacterium]|nr:glycosyltransferase family 4 protein [Dehalococcoidales bacterium]
MRILIVGNGTPRIPPKPTIPVTIYLHTLAEQLVRLGNEVDVVIRPTPEKEPQKYNYLEIGKPGVRPRNIHMRNLYEIWFSTCLAIRLHGLCKRNHYDIVHFFENPVPSFLSLLIDKKDRPRFLFSSGMAVSGIELNWGIPDKTGFLWRASMALHGYIFRKMPHLTVSSERLKEVVVALTGVRPEKINIAPFVAAEPDIFRPIADVSELKQSLGLNPDDLVVLCLAPVAPYKNQLSVVKAIPAVVEKYHTARFLFVGETTIPEYYGQIQQFIRENALEKHALFTGFIKDYADLPKYYNLADVYILPSVAEGLPKVLLEAMSCGRAIVASSISQNKEPARYGDEMLFIEPHKPESIANAINKLLGDPGLRKKLGENARRTVAEYFTPEAVAKRMAEVYEGVNCGGAQ